MAYRLTALGCAAVAGVGAWLWFAPSGTGEFRRSPDGRFTAHAMNLRAGTLAGRRETYIDIRVVEEKSGREVWRVVHLHAADAQVPDYGTRGVKFVAWASDSSAVTVPVAGGRELVLEVPLAR